MGVKSTVTLRRCEAERRFIEAYVASRLARREDEVRLRLEHLRHDGGFGHEPSVSRLGVTDGQARETYVAIDALAKRPGYQAKARRKLAKLSRDADLEDALERINDEANDGEGFENYLITRADD